jgi:hypothetical protein
MSNGVHIWQMFPSEILLLYFLFGLYFLCFFYLNGWNIFFFHHDQNSRSYSCVSCISELYHATSGFPFRRYVRRIGVIRYDMWNCYFNLIQLWMWWKTVLNVSKTNCSFRSKWYMNIVSTRSYLYHFTPSLSLYKCCCSA